MKSDFDPRARMSGLHATVAELDRLSANLERALARVAALAPADGAHAREIADVRTLAEAALRCVAAERPGVLAMISAAHGTAPRD